MIVHPVLQQSLRHEARLGLTRLRSFLTHLGDPLAGLQVIHVAGTNGKGSVVHVLAAALRAAGHRVGTFTSPHLQRLNERIRVDGEEIDDETLDALLWELDAARREWGRAPDSDEVDEDAALNFFELLTAAGVLHMARAAVDVAIVEVGLGGRLDATNLVDPLVSVITTVSMDHVDRLGPDLASIASEKAGVIKPGRPVVVGLLAADALKVVRLTAAERDAPISVAGEDFRTLNSAAARFSWASDSVTYRDLPLALQGEHQVDNAGVALAVLRAVQPRLPVSEADLRVALATVRFPGRLEWLADDLLIDAAHNSDGAATLARYLAGLSRDRGRTLVLGTNQGKDVRSMVVALSPQVDRILTTHGRHPAAASASEIAEQLVGLDIPILPAGPIEQALPLARSSGALVIVTGSVFLAGAARDLTHTA